MRKLPLRLRWLAGLAVCALASLAQVPAPDGRASVMSAVFHSLWAHDKRYAIAGLLVFAVQLSLIAMLLMQRSRRRRAESALRESETRYRRVVETQSDAICRFRPDSTLTFVNDAYCRFVRRSAVELVGVRILDLVPDEGRENIRRHLASLVESPGTGRYEHPVVWPDGSPGWLEWVIHSVAGPDGRVAELLGIGRDITARKDVENALRHSEARNRAMLRALPDLMFVMSRDGVYLDYHARDPRDLFVPPEQFIGKTVADVMPPALASTFADAIAKASNSVEPSVVEYSLPMADGERFFEVRLVGFELDQVLSIVRDVTVQKRAEERLRVSQDRYALATAAGGVGVWDWNVETDELYVDPAVLRILGYDGNEPRNHPVEWRRFVHPQDQESTIASGRACLQGRADMFDIEHRVYHKDGTSRWFHTRGSAVRREDGTAYRLVGTFTDVTDRQRAEQALRENEAILHASFQEIQDLAGRLIAGQETERKRLARELHDDLSQKVALLTIDVDQLDHGAGDFSERVRRISERAGDIAIDMHLLSHRLHPFKLEALGLVAALESLCRDVSTQHGIKVEFRHGNTPTQVPPDVALCLFRIAQEGLRNVVKHSKAANVWLRLQKVNRDLAMQLNDSGIGFVPADHERTGLGLVSMRERVHFLGGKLSIDSGPGEGTRIGVRVPLESEWREGAADLASA